MKIGDLVRHSGYGVGIIIGINDPTIIFPYQIANVQFIDPPRVVEIVTTSLHLYKSSSMPT